MESSGIPGSPNTPLKKVMSKTRCARKYLLSLLCEMSLVGERCTFNVENHPGPRAKLQSIIEESIDVTVQSSRLCRPCGRKMQSLQSGDATNQGVSLKIFFMLSQDGKCKVTHKVKPLAHSSQKKSLRSIIAFFMKF